MDFKFSLPGENEKVVDLGQQEVEESVNKVHKDYWGEEDKVVDE